MTTVFKASNYCWATSYTAVQSKTRAGDERRRPKVRKEEKERNMNRKYWGGLTLFLS